MKGSSIERLLAAVDAGLPSDHRALLAVSGGMDSMVLLHAALRTREVASLAVATFDHASGEHAAAAADLVERTAMQAGVSVIVGRGESVARPSEATWRNARHAFLDSAAVELNAVVCTAHSRDDQVETVLFRELRGAGTRGLAGLAARSDTARPLLAIARREIADYARASGVEWMDDPTNENRSFSRNRIRIDLLPAMRAVAPEIDDALVDVGDRAARWRADVERWVDAHLAFEVDRDASTLAVDARALEGRGDEALAIVWPALLARVGIAADWRGTRRLVAFTTRSRTGQRIQLSGGWVVRKRRGAFEVAREGRTDAGATR